MYVVTRGIGLCFERIGDDVLSRILGDVEPPLS